MRIARDFYLVGRKNIKQSGVSQVKQKGTLRRRETWRREKETIEGESADGRASS